MSTGVVSLPTGRTPEHFIKWTKHFLRCWDEPDVQEFLDSSGLQVAKGKPRLEGLTFVQMDEFYPCNPAHHNSFNYYLRTFYLEPLGLDPKKASAKLMRCNLVAQAETNGADTQTWGNG
eukprot:scaffold1522_cov340-Prasinococcus_capsulatus_cf.AAC.14